MPRDVALARRAAAAVDDPAAYQLYDLGRGCSVPLRVTLATPASSCSPRRPLRPGRYVFVATHEGMFGGRDYAYLRSSPDAPVRRSPRRAHTVPAVADALLSACAPLLALRVAALLAALALPPPSGEKALWALGFLLFAVAAGCEALAQRTGWSPGLFRTYYLAGGVLTVAYLGAGSAWLLLPPRARRPAGGLAVADRGGGGDGGARRVHSSGSPPRLGRPPANSALGGHAFLWAVGLNSLGSPFLIGGALYSIVRRQRVRANVWIGGGAVVVALATGLSRAGDYSFVYAGELVGIALMFVGFAFVGRKIEPTPARKPEASPSRPALAR